MSLVMSIYLHNAILMAGDSRITKSSGYISDTGIKVFVSKNNVGILTCGNSGVKGNYISCYIDEFLKIHSASTVTEIANAINPYFLALEPELDTTFIVAGYELTSKGDVVQKKYRAYTKTNAVEECNYTTGAQWNGITDVVSRLINDTFYKNDDGSYEKYNNYGGIDWDQMTIQEGVNFLKFAIRTTEQMMSFQNRQQSVGGDIDILAITPDGSKWISKKELL